MSFFVTDMTCVWSFIRTYQYNIVSFLQYVTAALGTTSEIKSSKAVLFALTLKRAFHGGIGIAPFTLYSFDFSVLDRRLRFVSLIECWTSYLSNHIMTLSAVFISETTPLTYLNTKTSNVIHVSAYKEWSTVIPSRMYVPLYVVLSSMSGMLEWDSRYNARTSFIVFSRMPSSLESERWTDSIGWLMKAPIFTSSLHSASTRLLRNIASVLALAHFIPSDLVLSFDGIVMLWNVFNLI